MLMLTTNYFFEYASFQVFENSSMLSIVRRDRVTLPKIIVIISFGSFINYVYMGNYQNFNKFTPDSTNFKVGSNSRRK